MREMKDSGVTWIGEVPVSWQTMTIGSLFKVRNEKVNDTDYPPLSVTRGGIVPQIENVAKTDANDNRKKVLVDDFVINSRSDRKQSCGVSPLDGSVSLINIVLFPATNAPIIPAYLNYLLKNYGFAEEFYRWGHGIVADLWTTRWQEMKSILLPIPSVDEQQRILDAISSESEKVDALIANVQVQIERLKAYKQSLITEVVTKGLDPTVPMKDSELLWFGTVPKHWKLAKIKLFASTCSGGTPPSGDMSYYDGDVNWVCSYDLHEAEITETGKTLSEKGAALIAGEMQSPNSILIAMYGGSGTIGNSGLLKCFARTNQAICSVHFDEAVVDPRFALYQTMFIRKCWMYYAVGTRKDPNISQDVVRNMKYVIPPMEEQLKIVKLLDEKCSQIDRLIAIKQAKIEKLEQYKRSLIYEYVTGKKEAL